MPNPGASSLLEKALTDAFQSPEYSVGRLIPSERELCERFAVSRTTLRGVLRLLTDQGLLASEAGRGHRLLRRRARAASASAIADFFVAELVNPFYAGLASLMSGIFREKGMELRVHDYAHRYESLPGRILECQKGASPVVVHFPGDREALANFARAVKPPLVLIHPMAPLAGELPFDQVVLDSYGGGRRAMEHLLSVGRRRIAYLGLDGQAPERLRGARAAAQAHGLPRACPELLTMQLAGYPGAFEAVERAFGGRAPYDAIFCANDDVALGAIAGLRARGVAVPRQVAVVGFDDIPAARMVRPALTTLRQDLLRLSSLVLELALKPTQRGRPRTFLFENELIVRGSTLELEPDTTGEGAVPRMGPGRGIADRGDALSNKAPRAGMPRGKRIKKKSWRNRP